MYEALRQLRLQQWANRRLWRLAVARCKAWLDELNLILAAYTQAHGYHRHTRGRWRLRKGPWRYDPQPAIAQIVDQAILMELVQLGHGDCYQVHAELLRRLFRWRDFIGLADEFRHQVEQLVDGLTGAEPATAPHSVTNDELTLAGWLESHFASQSQRTGAAATWVGRFSAFQPLDTEQGRFLFSLHGQWQRLVRRTTAGQAALERITNPISF
jgi:hypothetical protein